VRELFGPQRTTDKFPFEWAKPNKEMVKMAILLLHAQVKAARLYDESGFDCSLRHRQIVFPASRFILDDFHSFRSQFRLGAIHGSVPQFKPSVLGEAQCILSSPGRLTDIALTVVTLSSSFMMPARGISESR
jgi:hypothetical protein